MGQAYEALLLDLGLKDRHSFTEIIAKEIIQVASRGVHDTPAIRARVLAALERATMPRAAPDVLLHGSS